MKNRGAEGEDAARAAPLPPGDAWTANLITTSTAILTTTSSGRSAIDPHQMLLWGAVRVHREVRHTLGKVVSRRPVWPASELVTRAACAASSRHSTISLLEKRIRMAAIDRIPSAQDGKHGLGQYSYLSKTCESTHQPGRSSEQAFAMAGSYRNPPE